MRDWFSSLACSEALVLVMWLTQCVTMNVWPQHDQKVALMSVQAPNNPSHAPAVKLPTATHFIFSAHLKINFQTQKDRDEHKRVSVTHCSTCKGKCLLFLNSQSYRRPWKKKKRTKGQKGWSFHFTVRKCRGLVGKGVWLWWGGGVTVGFERHSWMWHSSIPIIVIG